jgi:uncharacterized membrane protein YphA (DoxX/SURF4 family)
LRTLRAPLASTRFQIRLGVAMVEQGDIFGIRPLINDRSRNVSRTGLALSKAIHLFGFGIGAIFFWFALLKLSGVSPTVELLRHSVPFLAEYPYIQLLAIVEVLIGLGLIIDKLSRLASALMMVNIVCTLGIVLLAPALVFVPESHELTTQGAFLTNYIISTLVGLLFISWRQRRG